MRSANPEEVFSGSSVKCSILDLCLSDEIVSALYRRQHAFDRQEGRQIGSVRGDDDQRIKPPNTASHSARQRSSQIHARPYRVTQ